MEILNYVAFKLPNIGRYCNVGAIRNNGPLLNIYDRDSLNATNGVAICTTYT